MRPHPAAALLVRFALPLAVAIHYLTAARGFAFTPDAAYGAANAAILLPSGGGGELARSTFSPLWGLLLEAGRGLALDPLLTAKILALLFSSLGVLAVYLLAVEILEDRILAFLAALVGGLEPWLLSAASGGTPLPLLFGLTYGAYFFLRRGEFAIGGILVGLAGLASWPAFGLIALLIIEVLTSSRGNHAPQRIVAGMLMAASTAAAWVVYAFLHSLPWFSGSGVPGETISPSWWQAVPFLIAGGVAGMGWRAAVRFPILRLMFPGNRASLVAFFVWGGVCAAACSPSYLILLGPACVILALDGIRKIAPSMYRAPFSYAPAVALAASVVILYQVVTFVSVRPAMESAIERGGEVEAVAAWLRAHLPAGTEVGAEPGGELGYLLRADLRVERMRREAPSPYAVRGASPGEGYREVYRPSEQAGIAVFKRMVEE